MLELIARGHNGLVRRKKLTEINNDIRTGCLDKFKTFVKEGIILSDYEDMAWKTTDQKAKFIFRFKATDLTKICGDISYDEVVDVMKIVSVLMMGTCDLKLIRSVIGYTQSELFKSDFGRVLVTPDDALHGSCLAYYIDILRLLPVPDEYLELCKRTLAAIRLENLDAKKDRKHPCSLNEFMSYFKIDYIINEFMEHCSYDETSHYLPFFLFWIITTVLPMRVTEFCVTPYDCIRTDGARYFLTIRRSRLKGHSAILPKHHAYKLDEDYVKYEYEITEKIFHKIKDYKERTKDHNHPHGLLFSTDFLNGKNGIFSTKDLAEIIKTFYKDVVVGRYGYDIIDEDDLMKRYRDEEDGSYEMYDDEIMLIQAKHTRHLAMINLIYRGCNPMMIREFAGHTEETTSANYYGNVSKTVRCLTKMYYERSKNIKARQENHLPVSVDYNPLSILIDENAPSIAVDGGNCYSEKFINGSINDCIRCDGICSNCRFFLPDGKPDTKKLEETVDIEMEYLTKMLKSEKLDALLDDFNAKVHTLETDMYGLAAKVWISLMKEEA